MFWFYNDIKVTGIQQVLSHSNLFIVRWHLMLLVSWKNKTESFQVEIPILCTGMQIQLIQLKF